MLLFESPSDVPVKAKPRNFILTLKYQLQNDSDGSVFWEKKDNGAAFIPTPHPGGRFSPCVITLVGGVTISCQNCVTDWWRLQLSGSARSGEMLNCRSVKKTQRSLTTSVYLLLKYKEFSTGFGVSYSSCWFRKLRIMGNIQSSVVLQFNEQDYAVRVRLNTLIDLVFL